MTGSVHDIHGQSFVFLMWHRPRASVTAPGSIQRLRPGPPGPGPARRAVLGAVVVVMPARSPEPANQPETAASAGADPTL